MADSDTHLPINPVEFSILLVLQENEASWGYGIVKAIAAATHGAIRLAPGNLYQILDRLLGRGWIRQVPAAPGEDSRRRYYGLTKDGRAAVRAEAGRLRALMPTLARMDLVPSTRPR